MAEHVHLFFSACSEMFSDVIFHPASVIERERRVWKIYMRRCYIRFSLQCDMSEKVLSTGKGLVMPRCHGITKKTTDMTRGQTIGWRCCTLSSSSSCLDLSLHKDGHSSDKHNMGTDNTTRESTCGAKRHTCVFKSIEH